MATLAEEYDDLYEAKKEIADAITDVGEKFGIKANEADSFRSYADKILKIGNSIWSSAEDSEEQHLLITENGYYDVNDLSKQYFDDADKYSAVSSLWISVQSAPVIVGKRNIYVGEASEITVSRPEPLVVGADYATQDDFIDALATALNATKTKVSINYSDFWKIVCPNGATFFSYTSDGASTYRACPGPVAYSYFINGGCKLADLYVYGNQDVLIFAEYESRYNRWRAGMGIYVDEIINSKGSTFEKTYLHLYVDDSSGVDIHNTFFDWWMPINQLRLGYNDMYSTLYYQYDKQYGKDSTEQLVSKFEIGMQWKRDECPPSVGGVADLGDYALFYGDWWNIHYPPGGSIANVSGLSIDGVNFAHIAAGLFRRVTSNS